MNKKGVYYIIKIGDNVFKMNKNRDKKNIARFIILVLLEMVTYLPVVIIICLEEFLDGYDFGSLGSTLMIITTILYIIGIIIVDSKLKLNNKDDYIKTNIFSVLLLSALILVIAFVIDSVANVDETFYVGVSILVMLVGKYFVINLIVDELFGAGKNSQ